MVDPFGKRLHPLQLDFGKAVKLSKSQKTSIQVKDLNRRRFENIKRLTQDVRRVTPVRTGELRTSWQATKLDYDNEYQGKYSGTELKYFQHVATQSGQILNTVISAVESANRSFNI